MPARPESAWDQTPPSEAAPSHPPFGEGRRRQARRGSMLVAALVLSVSLHFAIVTAMALSALLSKEEERPQEATFEIVDASELNYRVPLPELDLPGAQEIPKDTSKNAQLVDVAAPKEKEVAPQDAKFLAEHDRRVEQETRARDTALVPEVLADQFRGLGKDPNTGDAALQGKSDHVGENDGAEEKNATAKAEKRIDEVLKSDPFGIRVKPIGGSGGADERTMVAAGNGAKVAMAGAPNNDYLPHVREGDATLLNSKATFFASFWNRVLKQVEPFWAQNVRSTNPGRDLQKRDYRTDVNVVLSPKGELIAVEVVRSCGIPAWDRAVQEAFRQGAPFLNPPKELVSADGRIYMDDLGFIVQLTGGAQVHMYGDPRSGKLFPGVREGYGPSR